MRISFTQFMRPRGHQITVDIDRPEDIARKARQLNDAGYVFEIEVLTTGEISMEVVKSTDNEQVLANEICTNGPQVPICVDRMVNSAYEKIVKTRINKGHN